MLFIAFACISACSGGGSSVGTGGGGTGGGSNPPPSGTTPDTYTVTFHVADAATGTITAQDYLKFTVN